MQSFFKYLFFFLVGWSVCYFFVRQTVTVEKVVEVPATSNERLARPTKKTALHTLFSNMGIKNGDLLTSVNGVMDSTMISVMEMAYQKGNVCVHFDRDSAPMELCLRKTNLLMSPKVSHLRNADGTRVFDPKGELNRLE